MNEEIKFIDLFSGIDGFRLGFQKAGGFKCVWSCDNDPIANEIHIRNFETDNHYTGDIREVDSSSIPDHDILAAGFPCPSFSVSGKRKGFEDTRGTLFFEIVRIAEAKRPTLLLLENVVGLLSNDEGKTFKTILEVLGGLGYWIEWQVLGTDWFGLPQSRKRIFIIGHHGGPPKIQIFPIEKTGETPIEEANKPIQIGTLREGRYETGQRVYDRRGQSVTIKALAGGDGAKTGLYLVPLVIQKNQRDEIVYKKIVGAIHPSMGNNQSSFIVDENLGIRKLTELECERLQGFPDGWTDGLGYSYTKRLEKLGNAVSVNVIEFLGRRIRARVS